MADTIRTEEELLAAFSDNENGDITAQFLRDFVVSVFNEVSLLQEQIDALDARITQLEP